MKKKLLKFVFVVLLCCGGLSQAAPITIKITGNVTGVGVTLASVPDSIHAGVPFTGTYTYDSAAPDSDANPQRGVYQYNSPYGISISLGGYEFKTAPNHVGQFEMRIINDQVDNGVHDYYTVFSDENVSIPSVGFEVNYISWNLGDSTHTALSSGDLPVTAPVLTDWDYNVLAISGYDSFGHGIFIKGTVTQAIPEPLTSLLMMTGVFLLRRRR
ncbi:MAG: hypothetical protein WCW64_11585 [Phycisphaerae bacterium]